MKDLSGAHKVLTRKADAPTEIIAVTDYPEISKRKIMFESSNCIHELF